MYADMISGSRQTWSPLPVILDEIRALERIRLFTGQHIIDLDECQSGMIDRVFLFQKAEEKKQFSVVDARNFIEEISLQPYDGSALYILRDFDEATLEAMNACLKTFEEPPSYAHILIVVKSPEKLLETIRSRSLLDFHEPSQEPLPESLSLLIASYYNGDPSGFISYLHRSKYDDTTALSILRSAASYAWEKQLELIEEAMNQIVHVNESSRNILERVFLYQEI